MSLAEMSGWLAARRASVPDVTYPEQLPVSQNKDEILAAIRDHHITVSFELARFGVYRGVFATSVLI